MQQGVLFSAIRSADGVSQEERSKLIVRELRDTLIKSARSTGSFLGRRPTPADLRRALNEFVDGFGHYNIHFVMHLMHAAEIIGYKHPNREVRWLWSTFYSSMCEALHVNPETRKQMENRLHDDPDTVAVSERHDESSYRCDMGDKE
jgi:hypothetical protein